MVDIDIHVNEMKKLSYTFLVGIAYSKDPLSYTYSDSKGSVQVELQAIISKSDMIEVIIGIDSSDKTSKTILLHLAKDGTWI